MLHSVALKIVPKYGSKLQADYNHVFSYSVAPLALLTQL